MASSQPVSGIGTDRLLVVLTDGASAVREAIGAIDAPGRRRPGERKGQYYLDLVADEALCEVLHGAGLAVLSEESGRSGPGDADLLIVADPVDGSTNASLGIPWFSTSLCALDADGPLAGLVVDQVSGSRFEAVRGSGATRDGRPLRASGCADLSDAVIAISGFPAAHPGWAQFRALGAASLDMCAVAAGILDGYCVVGNSALFAWDYLAAMLICMEAGAIVSERDGQELVVRDASPRRPTVAATATLSSQLSLTPL